jgi:hypothetical protein
VKAAVVHEFGAPLQIEELPTPRPGDGEPLARVEASGLCHIDFGPEAEAGVHGAAELARALDAELEVIRAFGPEATPLDIDNMVELKLAARSHLAQTVKALSPALNVGRVFAEDAPADLLVERSQQLDLLVIGSRGYGPYARCCSAACPDA